jgi:CheY-like chemotaxis protein
MESQQSKSVEQRIALPVGSGQLVLVVDDEVSVREMLKATLEAYGYRGLVAADGTEAVALSAQHQGQVQAVIMDMMMPIMDGPATIRALEKLDPQVRIIAASGASERDQAPYAHGLRARVFLAKPFAPDKLLRALHDLLAGRTRSDDRTVASKRELSTGETAQDLQVAKARSESPAPVANTTY